MAFGFTTFAKNYRFSPLLSWSSLTLDEEFNLVVFRNGKPPANQQKKHFLWTIKDLPWSMMVKNN